MVFEAGESGRPGAPGGGFGIGPVDGDDGLRVARKRPV